MSNKMIYTNSSGDIFFVLNSQKKFFTWTLIQGMFNRLLGKDGLIENAEILYIELPSMKLRAYFIIFL